MQAELFYPAQPPRMQGQCPLGGHPRTRVASIAEAIEWARRLLPRLRARAYAPRRDESSYLPRGGYEWERTSRIWEPQVWITPDRQSGFRSADSFAVSLETGERLL